MAAVSNTPSASSVVSAPAVPIIEIDGQRYEVRIILKDQHNNPLPAFPIVDQVAMNKAIEFAKAVGFAHRKALPADRSATLLKEINSQGVVFQDDSRVLHNAVNLQTVMGSLAPAQLPVLKDRVTELSSDLTAEGTAVAPEAVTMTQMSDRVQALIKRAYGQEGSGAAILSDEPGSRGIDQLGFRSSLSSSRITHTEQDWYRAVPLQERVGLFHSIQQKLHDATLTGENDTDEALEAILDEEEIRMLKYTRSVLSDVQSRGGRIRTFDVELGNMATYNEWASYYLRNGEDATVAALIQPQHITAIPEAHRATDAAKEAWVRTRLIPTYKREFSQAERLAESLRGDPAAFIALKVQETAAILEEMQQQMQALAAGHMIDPAVALNLDIRVSALMGANTQLLAIKEGDASIVTLLDTQRQLLEVIKDKHALLKEAIDKMTVLENARTSYGRRRPAPDLIATIDENATFCMCIFRASSRFLQEHLELVRSFETITAWAVSLRQAAVADDLAAGSDDDDSMADLASLPASPRSVADDD